LLQQKRNSKQHRATVCNNLQYPSTNNNIILNTMTTNMNITSNDAHQATTSCHNEVVPAPKYPTRVAVKVKPEHAESAELDPNQVYHTFFNPDFPESGRKWDSEDKVWRYFLEEKLFIRRLYREDIFEPVLTTVL